MSSAIHNLLALSDALAAHEGVTHWAVSMRIAGKGDFLDRLRHGGDCGTRTYERVLAKLEANWPADLARPSQIERPKARGRHARTVPR